MLVSEKPCGPNANTCGLNADPCGPNMSMCNIGRVGHPRIGACVGHVDFMLFVLISFALSGQHKSVFQWNMGFSQLLFNYYYFYVHFSHDVGTPTESLIFA